MKNINTLAALLFAIAVFQLACTKERQPREPRTVHFVLYTEKDFSGQEGNITFTVYAKNGRDTVFDSTWRVMKVRDIPTKANKIVFEKTFEDNGSDLEAGFKYYLENVGYSWYYDTCRSGEKFKVIEYSFR